MIAMANTNEVSFNVTKSIWRLNATVNGWQKEVNMVAWNSNKPRIDIRDWNIDKTKMKKGLTLSKEEALELKRCLNNIDISALYDDEKTISETRTGPGPVDSGASFITAVELESDSTTEKSKEPEETENEEDSEK